MDRLDPVSFSLIVGCVGEECLEPLKRLGVQNIHDITCLQDVDLQRAGLNMVQIRKLQTVAADANLTWSLWNTPLIAEPRGLSTAMGVPPPPTSLLPPSGKELERLQDALTEAEQKAINSLDISAEEDVDVAQCALTAREQLTQHPHTPVLAIQAQNAVIRALSHCQQGKLRKQLEEAQRCTRDVIVLRLQKEVPLGSRSTFINAMETAYGVSGAMPSDTVAKLMHAHSQVVCPLFPHAFVSISRKENAARRHGPRGKRPRDARRVAALAAEDVSEFAGGDSSAASSEPSASSGLATPLPEASSNDTIRPPPGLHIMD